MGPAATANLLVLHPQFLLWLEILISVFQSLFLYFFHIHTNSFTFLSKQLTCCMAVQNYSLFSLMIVVYLDFYIVHMEELFAVNKVLVKKCENIKQISASNVVH